jgi:hypothetical protein
MRGAAVKALLVGIPVLTAGSLALTSVASSQAGPRVYPLAVAEVKTPHIRFSCPAHAGLTVSGRYPQVFRGSVTLSAVNAVIRAAVLADQRSLVAGVNCGPLGPAPGYYETIPRLELISASSVVFSALIPSGKIPPGANFSIAWTAITVRIATARLVTVTDLFRSPKEGLRALAALARRRLSARSHCVRDYANPAGFEPSVENFKHFALTTTGLALGFSAGQVSLLSCGSMEVTLPYAPLRPYLSALGRELVAGVRRPIRRT